MTDSSSPVPSAREGVIYGVTAYCIWGFFPLYFKALASLSSQEVVAHRVLWSAAVLGLLVAATRRGPQLRSALVTPRIIAPLLGSTALIFSNWFFFIHAVSTGRVLESSLGYFINPLVSVLLGVVFLREQLRPLQAASVGLAAVGVAVQAWMLGQIPVIALVLAFSFGGYGLIRKTARIDPVAGLAVEMFIMVPFAGAFLLHLASSGGGSFLAGDLVLDTFLVLSGLVTVIPLVLFGAATQRLRLATLGLLQYIVPTGHFLLAVLAFGEPFTGAHLVSFGCIWVALAVYTWDGWRRTARDQGGRRQEPTSVCGSG